MPSRGPKRLDNLLPLAVVGAIATDVQAGRRPVSEADDDGAERRAQGRPANWRNRSLNLIAGLKLARAGSGSIGTGLARLSKPPAEAISRRNYFGGRVVLRTWNSRLSAAFNALDVPPGITVKSSAGRMIEYQGQAWHAGTTVVETAAGERAITHLTRLQWPGQQIYFSRGLSEQELAGILSGHQEYEPKHLPGFAGEVGEVEALLPGRPPDRSVAGRAGARDRCAGPRGGASGRGSNAVGGKPVEIDPARLAGQRGGGGRRRRLCGRAAGTAGARAAAGRRGQRRVQAGAAAATTAQSGIRYASDRR